MTVVSEIVTLLEADTGAGGVATLATGGIYDWEADLDEEGLSRQSASSAFNSTTGVLKPCCVVRSRATVPDNGIYDAGTGDLSVRQVVEIWMYDDKDNGHSTLRSLKSRVKTVLHEKTTTSSYRPRYLGTPIEGAREADLNQATMLRSDYEVRSIE